VEIGTQTVKNQMFSQMNRAALERLADRAPMPIARNAGICYDEKTQTFHFQSLGNPIAVHYPDYSFSPELSAWHRLLILHYLDLADGFPLTGKVISFGQMRSGMIRGSGIDHKCALIIQKAWSLHGSRLADILDSIGGEPIPSNADLAYCIPFLPKFPITLNIWFPDADFPVSGRMLLDSSADHYLTIEDAVTAAEILFDKLIG